MDEENGDDSTKHLPLRDLKIEPEAGALLDSAAMGPYMNLAMAVMGGQATGEAVKELAALPLEKRYVWRVASALTWAFVDFDTLNVEADRETLSPEDRKRLVDLVKHRPLQFCLFLSALLGQREMELLMASAIRDSRTIAAQSEEHERR